MFLHFGLSFADIPDILSAVIMRAYANQFSQDYLITFEWSALTPPGKKSLLGANRSLFYVSQYALEIS